MDIKSIDLGKQRGYQVRLTSSVVFNLARQGMGDDSRDLSIYVSYMGAEIPKFEADHIFDDDPYVVSRLDPVAGSIWNPLAYRGFYGFSGGGTWAGPDNIINIKDEGIKESGLKIIFGVPDELKDLKGLLSIYVNDKLLKQVSINEPGQQIVHLDISRLYDEEEEYLSNAHRILKILLKDFDRVCNKYHLRYYLICGSLLGAVRSGDLIAWDDDVDVAMPRKDFDMLMKHVSDEWGKGKDIQFVNYNQMGNYTFLDYMSRIVYMKEEIPINVFRKISGKGRKDLENHMPMDIYVLDNASDNPRIHNIHTYIIQGLYGLAMGHRAYINRDEYNNREAKLQKIVKILSIVGRYIPLSFILGMYEMLRKCFMNLSCECYFESNGFIFCIPWKFKQEWFQEGIRLDIGGIPINVPMKYEEFLKMHYSENYMKLPPMEVRKPTHSINASGIY